VAGGFLHVFKLCAVLERRRDKGARIEYAE
jgi:hypothetical protein